MPSDPQKLTPSTGALRLLMSAMGGKRTLALPAYKLRIDDANYTPKSDFVWMAAHNVIPLNDGFGADSNRKLLIEFTNDSDKSNRDWATMALGLYGPDDEVTRQALLAAANDEDCDVRGEAIEALASRDASWALPLIARDLRRSPCGYGVFVAAALVASPTLVELLKAYDYESESTWIDRLIRDAIRACEQGAPAAHL